MWTLPKYAKMKYVFQNLGAVPYRYSSTLQQSTSAGESLTFLTVVLSVK